MEATVVNLSSAPMAPRSLDSLPAELLLQIAGYLTAPLHELERIFDHFHGSGPLGWERAAATDEEIAAFRCYARLNSLVRVCRKTYDVLNPNLYRLALQWMDFLLSAPCVSIGDFVSMGELGIRILDKFINAGLVGDLRRNVSSYHDRSTLPDMETFEIEARFFPSYVSVKAFPGRHRSVPVRPTSKFTSCWEKKRCLRPSKAIIPEDYIYFEPSGRLRQRWEPHQIRLLEVADNFLCQKHQDSYGGRPKTDVDEYESYNMAIYYARSIRGFRSPLHVAASLGNLEAMKRLLDVGFDPNALAEGHCQCTDLKPWSAGLPQYSVVPDPETRLPRWTPLHTAICHGEFEAAKMLISYGSDVYRILKHSGQGPTISAFHAAAGFGDVKLLDHLADSGFCSDPEVLVRTDRVGLTPLHWAIINGHLDTSAAWLLAHGVDIDTPAMKTNGRTGMDCSVLALTLRYECFYEACRLIDMGASVTQIATCDVPSSLHQACRRMRVYGAARFGEKPSSQPLVDSQHRTRVPDPSEQARVDTVKKLIDKGCKVDCRDPLTGLTTVGLATQNCLPQTVAYLLAAGASIDANGVWEAFEEAEHFTSPDGSGLATLLVIVDHLRAEDASFPDKVLYWLLSTKPPRIWGNRETCREAIRWIVAKGANPHRLQLPGETIEFNKLYLLAASVDFNSAEILSRSQMGLPVNDFEELIQSLSLTGTGHEGRAALICALDLSSHPWKEMKPPTLVKCLGSLIDGWSSERLAFTSGQTLLRFLDYAEDWIGSLEPGQLAQLLQSAICRLHMVMCTKGSERYLVPDTAVIHRLVHLICRTGVMASNGQQELASNDEVDVDDDDDDGDDDDYDEFKECPKTCPTGFFNELSGGICCNNDLWTYDELAPIYCTLIQHGAEVFGTCGYHGLDEWGEEQIQIHTVITAGCYKTLHSILWASPDLLQRHGEFGRRLLHYTAIKLAVLLDEKPRTQSDAGDIQLANSYLRIMCLLIQHGADPAECDDEGKVPLEFILVAALRRPQNLIFGAHHDGQVVARRVLPIAVRLLWHPSLAEHVIPADDWDYEPGGDPEYDDDMDVELSYFDDHDPENNWKAVWDMTVAECLQVLLSGTVDEMEFRPARLWRVEQKSADESRRIMAGSLRKTVRVWEDEAGSLKVEMLPMEWAGADVKASGGDDDGEVSDGSSSSCLSKGSNSF